MNGPGVPHPLTLAQEGLAGLEALRPGTSVGTTAEMIVSDARLDVDAVTAALDRCYAENEQLRVRVDLTGDRPTQVVCDLSGRTPLVVRRVHTASEQRAEIDRAVSEPFDLEHGPLVRAVLVRGPRVDRLIHCAHHLVLDGFGASLLLRRFAAVYSALVAGEDVPEPPRPAPSVADIVADDRERRSGPAALVARGAWTDRRRELPPVARPVDRVAGAGTVPLRRSRPLPADVAGALSRLRRDLGVGWQTLLVAGLGGLATVRPETGSVAIGVPAAGRMGRDRVVAAASPCAAVTVLPVLVPDGDVTLAHACARIRSWEQSGGAVGVTQEHLLALDRAEGVVRTPSTQLNVMPFAQRVTLAGRPCTVENLRVGPVPEWTLTLRGAFDDRDPVRVELDVNPAVVDVDGAVDEADALLDRALRRLSALADVDADTPLSALPRCGEAEESRLTGLHARSTRPVRARTLLEAFRVGAEAHPGRTALADEHTSLSTAQLWERSRALAGALLARGVGKGDVVGVHLPRSVEQVLLAHALLHLGAVYLPLHVDLPADRRADMCAQADARVVVDRAVYAELLTCPDAPPSPSPTGLDDPAYVLFTSGSTGRPKGVVITHRAIDNRLEWMQHECRLLPGETVLYKTPCSFDVHIWELYWAFRVGARVLVAPEGAERDPDALCGLICGDGRPDGGVDGIDVVHFVPSMLQSMLSVPSVRRRLADSGRLREIVCSGEALGRRLAESAHEATGVWPLNLYGPTEAAIDVTWFRTGPGQSDPDVPIGRPVWNTRCLVLDDADRVVPTGMPGTLWLGGVQLSTGYLGRPDLTAAAFVEHPRFGRLYDTGDLASRTADGMLRYHGRRDGQVKIRGQRVELGEIESVLRGADGVDDAVCLVEGSGASASVVAHLLAPARPDLAVDLAVVRAHAERTLTGAMVPARWFLHDRLPTTTNGKADRRALAGMAGSVTVESAVGNDPTAAGRDDDVLLAAVSRAFSEVLGRACGPDDDFFALGGDSLACVRLLGAIERAVGWTPRLEQVLSAPRPRALVEALAAPGSSGSAVVLLAPGPEPDSAGGPAPLVLLPPAGGLCWSYLPLVAHLGAERPVVALQTPLLDDPGWAGDTLADLCRWQTRVIADLVAERWPGRVVHLAGWSVGGTCAQEIAASGELDVLSVALLDAYPSERWRQRPEPDRRERLGALLRMGGVDESTLDEPVDTPDDVRRVLVERGSPLAALGPERLDVCLESVRVTSTAIRQHETRQWFGPAVHVGARASAEDGLVADDWAGATGTLRTLLVNDDHVGVVAPAHADRVAAALLDVARAAETERVPASG